MPKASKYGVRKTGGVLGNNSVVSYYGTLRTAINRAYKEGIIRSTLQRSLILQIK